MCVCLLKFALYIGKRTSGFFDPLLSCIFGSSWEIFSLLSKPTAADFGYGLPFSVLGRKVDAQLYSKVTSGTQNKNTEQMGVGDGGPEGCQKSPAAQAWPSVLISTLQGCMVSSRILLSDLYG